MYKLLFDADALIKLAHAGALETITKVCPCVTTPEVKREVVEEGQKRLYADADVIAELIEKKLLKIKEPKVTVTHPLSLEPGELSVLRLHQKLKGWMIVSDDQSFLRQLAKENIDVIVPADLLVLLHQVEKITSLEARTYLEGIRVFIRQEDYQRVSLELEGKIK